MTPRTVLLSGASSGIGAAIRERLLGDPRKRHRVIGLGRELARLPAPSERFAPEQLDLEDLEALPRRLEELARRHPGLDALVLCAGRGQFGGLEEFSYRDLRALVDLNFTSQAYLARAFLPQLKRRGGGDLIFIGSEAALQGKRQGAIYCATKFAVRGLAQALRDECGRSGVRVAVVHPGMVRTPFFNRLDFEPGAAADNAVLPEDVAAAVELILGARAETVFDEIVLSPRTRVVRQKRPGPGAE
jgi:NADP-dependent 3-hydroxy acid dehydrogenase YdfG